MIEDFFRAHGVFGATPASLHWDHYCESLEEQIAAAPPGTIEAWRSQKLDEFYALEYQQKKDYWTQYEKEHDKYLGKVEEKCGSGAFRSKKRDFKIPDKLADA